MFHDTITVIRYTGWVFRGTLTLGIWIVFVVRRISLSLGFVTRVVHIMLTIFTIMLIIYAQKMLLLCSKSPTIMLQIFPPDHPFFTAILEIGI